MRLIDADVFIEYLGLNAENSREENLGEIVTLEDFDAQPTAYDSNNVIEQLEDYLFEKYCVEADAKIEDIVKGGGVNEC